MKVSDSKLDKSYVVIYLNTYLGGLCHLATEESLFLSKLDRVLLIYLYIFFHITVGVRK